MREVPRPRVPHDRLQLRLARHPAEHPTRAFGGGHEPTRVSRSPGGFDHRHVAPGDLPADIDDFLYTKERDVAAFDFEAEGTLPRSALLDRTR